MLINRQEGGKLLAHWLRGYAANPDVVVLGLPRGGVPVAYEIAVALEAPLDVFMVRKIGAPWNEEFAVGAVASGGIAIVDTHAATALQVSAPEIDRLIAAERRELDRRERLYRAGRRIIDLTGKTVILVDDGMATGTTMRAAVEAVRTLRPGWVVVAAPVASAEASALLAAVADECVCVLTPAPFRSVATWYRDFTQTTDNEVLELLHRAAVRREAEPLLVAAAAAR